VRQPVKGDVSLQGISQYRPRSWAIKLLTLLMVSGSGTVLAACSSSGSSNTAVVQSVCTTVSDVLGNGPDPDDDPIGYAEAQPIPLRDIATSDTALKVAIDDLANAYENFYKTDGSPSAKAAVTGAGKKLNAICPGAVS
jgi:hypothetical protein